MKIYWIKAQAPRRVLALVKHLRVDAELVEVDLMRGGDDAPGPAAGCNGPVPGAERPDLADLRAVTNAPGPARSRS